MGVDVLLGLQWGDEGKGKIVDVLTPFYDVVARFQGGPNAGHTLEFDGNKHVLHTIPSGIFRPGVMNVVGNGVVIDPVVFEREMDEIKPYGIDLTKNLILSNKAHLITPTHRLLDAASENAKGDAKIGSTLRGIGPTYMDKTGRNGLRVGDVHSAGFEAKYAVLRGKHLQMLDRMDYSTDGLAEMEEKWFASLASLKRIPSMETSYYINKMVKAGKKVLAEGAQGSLLDIDFGTYPFVTSSNTICAGACTGLGISPKIIGKVFGIFKSYCTRVGSGPFPTELKDATGEFIRKKGNEFGATTGRPRRCGWLDMVALEYTCMINGVTDLLMMKADVLSDFEAVEVGVSYKIDGVNTTEWPYEPKEENMNPVWKTFKAWGSLQGIDRYEKLPNSLLDYIDFIEKQTGLPISIVSIGPDRKETIFCDQWAKNFSV